MLQDAQVSLQLDQFIGNELSRETLVEQTCRKFHREYLETLTALKADMHRKSNMITFFALAVIIFMTIKTILIIILIDQYNYWFFINLMIDLGIIVIVFVYSLCKIISIAKQNNIDIYRCYLFMHFASIILLTLTWTTAFYYYARQ